MERPPMPAVQLVNRPRPGVRVAESAYNSHEWHLSHGIVRHVLMLRLPLVLPIAAIAVLSATFTADAQSCSATSVTGNFGSVDVLSGAAVNATASFTVTCTGTANATLLLCIEFNRGTLNGNQRALSSGSNLLNFELYSNAAHTNIWGAWSGGLAGSSYPVGAGAGVSQTLTLNGSGNGSVTDTVYGVVLASQQTTPPGTYTWSHGAPYVGYGYKGANACPTDPGGSTNSGTTWTATVNSSCNVSVGTLNFGSTPSIISAAIDSTATITAQCTDTTPYSVGLDNGLNVSGSQRRMQLGATGKYINYNLYTDSGYSHAWSTTTSTTSCTAGSSSCALGTGTGSNQTYTIYGQVPAQTAPAAGTFSDTVVVTSTF
jgi:spore coat protein U-like protein